MNRKLKSTIKKLIPKPAIVKLLNIHSQIKSQTARKIFEQAPETPIWLDFKILQKLQQHYPFPPKYGYDPQSLEQRGKERASSILNSIRSERKDIKTFLELGCWDGMVSCALQRMGKVTTAIDNRSEGFDKRTVREGVKLLQMDAANLQFEDESFDYVSSYDSFEHFVYPDIVLKEAVRVVKTGGYIHLAFGPLYMSPLGLHAYRSITVPYCQLLFPKELLQDFTKVNGLNPIDFAQVNGWTLENFRTLWNRYTKKLNKIKYYERPNVSHLDLIKKYPSCFKSKTKCFDNLIIAYTEVLFKKISQ